MNSAVQFEIIKPGLATSVQDLGRSGYYHLGIPPSGAMDQRSSLIANVLVGNSEQAAVLECAIIGPEIRFLQATLVAVAGADMQPKINGVAVAMHSALAIQAGDVLSLSFAKTGARAYLAVAGGIDVPEALGSRSTYAIGALGGYHGRALQKGDVLSSIALNIDTEIDFSRAGQVLPDDLQLSYSKDNTLRMMLGLYDHRVEPDSLAQFFSESWQVASEADRMGYRFKGGTPLRYRPRTPPFGAGDDPSNIVDAGYPIGSIQVPAGKEPIILHRDAVSGGGYMMIGAVISADMDKIGQLPPNTRVQFITVSREEALAARRAYQADRARILGLK